MNTQYLIAPFVTVFLMDRLSIGEMLHAVEMRAYHFYESSFRLYRLDSQSLQPPNDQINAGAFVGGIHFLTRAGFHQILLIVSYTESCSVSYLQTFSL